MVYQFYWPAALLCGQPRHRDLRLGFCPVCFDALLSIMLRISPSTLPSRYLQTVTSQRFTLCSISWPPMVLCFLSLLNGVALGWNNLLQLFLLYLEIGQARSSQSHFPLASSHALQLLCTIHKCFSYFLQNQHTFILVNRTMVLTALSENEFLCVSHSTGFAWRFFQMFLFTD